MRNSAILVAAGSSRRMGFDKLAASISGKSVLEHTVRTFIRSELFSEIILVCDKARFETLSETTYFHLLKRVEGGAKRHLSVANGLAAVSENTELIAVHDAARPCVKKSDIGRTLSAAAAHGAASLAHQLTETIKRADASGHIAESVSRENLWAMETPQIFQASLLKKAYHNIIEAGATVTDETSAVEALGTRVKLVASTAPNIKITTPADLILAEILLR